MSDSDSELLTNNLLTFQNESTIVSARGPNINASSIKGRSFRDRVMSSTLQFPKNFERSRYAESHCERSMHRRETSPMSVMSACDMRQRNFNNSFNPRGMSSQRSVIHGRSGSPTMSMRSIDSNASVNATSIAMAFKNMHFNKYDLRIIKEAYNKFMKHRVRKKIEKRRNLKLFLKGKRRTSGYDSGEMGSDSSVSSDDRSHISSFKENRSCRSTKTDILTDFRRSIKESDMFKDRTDHLRQSSFRSKVRPTDCKSICSMPSFRNTTVPKQAPFNRDINNTQNSASSCLKDRFQNGFLLPSQRFNKSVATSVIHEDTLTHNNNHYNKNVQNTREYQDSDQDDIFSRPSEDNQKNNNQRKHSIDTEDDMFVPSTKRTKVASPCKNSAEVLNARNKPTVQNDFIFAKPIIPAKKNVKERLLAKSAGSLSDTIIKPPEIQPAKDIQVPAIETVDTEKGSEKCKDDETSQNTTDVSMRPSFIKRKLFSQKQDMAEKKCMSGVENSPQGSIYSAIQKEKHKARKLATNNSCMSRDIQDESNLLDLIHKIVPPNSMNITHQTNRTETNSKKIDDPEKWDITSIIANNNDEEMSDTYTDEEIFHDNNATVKSTSIPSAKEPPQEKAKAQPVKENKQCKVVIENIPINNIEKSAKMLEKHGLGKDKVQKCITSFWDTDYESDIDCGTRKNDAKQKQSQDTEHPKNTNKPQGFASIFKRPPPSKLSATINSTINNTLKLNNTSIQIKSHRSTQLKDIIEKNNESIRSYFETNSKIKKVTDDFVEIKAPERPVIEEHYAKFVVIEPSKNECNKNKKSQEKKSQNKKGKEVTKSNRGNDSLSKDTGKDPVATKQQKKPANSKQRTDTDVPNKKSTTRKRDASETKESSKKLEKKTPDKNTTNQKSDPKTIEKAKEKTKSALKKSKIPSATKRKITPTKKTVKKTPSKTVTKPDKNIKSKTDENKKSSKVNQLSPIEKSTKAKTDKNKNPLKENKSPNEKSKKSKATHEQVKANTSPLNSSTLETCNKNGRPLRSCRVSKNNTLNNSSLVNLTLNMTLRPRNINTSTSFSHNLRKGQNINSIERFFI